MNILEWSKSEVAYGRKLVDSAVEGARHGEGEFLRDESLSNYLEGSALDAMVPTMLVACLGWFGGYSWRSHRRALTCAFLGGAIGFGASMLWENRKLTASVAASAWKSINKTRDAHWFEKNPINYA
jgi:hypothetical protein